MPDTAYTLIDADTHITEPADVWTSRVPARWKDRVPHVRRDEQSGEECWFLEDNRMMPVGMTAMAGWPEKFPNHPPSYEASHAGAYDASARLAYMDEIGCWAQVLYPNVGGFGSQFFLRLPDEELKLACVRAYNDFQIDWISPDPRRFVPVMATPFWDVPAAVAEIERCAARGHKGVLFTAAPQDFDLPFLADRHWDPLWAAAQDADLPISFHIGSGDDFVFSPPRIAAMGTAPAYALASCTLFLNNGIQLCDLLLSGVLSRFPRLRFVSVESGIGWIPFALEAADYSLEQGDHSDRRGDFDLKPSELFRRQVYACYWFEQGAADHFENVGVDHILFETDFPHPTCLYGNVGEVIEAGLGDQPDDVRRKILFENSAALYDIPLPSA